MNLMILYNMMYWGLADSLSLVYRIWPTYISDETPPFLIGWLKPILAYIYVKF